jgi:predicted PurR-regulated permease PerM
MPAVPSSAAPSAISARVILRVVITVVCVVLALYLIYLLRKPLTWIFIAGFLAIALSGPVNWLHRQIGRRGIAIAIVYVLLILVPVFLGALLVPPIVEQLNNLINNLPAYVNDLQNFIERNDRLRQLEENYNITAELENQAQTLPGRVGDAAGILSDIGVGVVNSIFAIVTILILSIFMVGAGPRWYLGGASNAAPKT